MNKKKRILLFTWRCGLLFSSQLWSEWHKQIQREKNGEGKKNLSDSWLTALINKKQLQVLCISSHSLWGLSGGDWEMAENSPWLYKLFNYSLYSCIHCSLRVRFNEDFVCVETQLKILPRILTRCHMLFGDRGL